jgi:hypothetical protein
MGRKGVSKRKPRQTKSKPFSDDNASGNVSSLLQTADNRPVNTYDVGKAVKSSMRHPSGGNKNR